MGKRKTKITLALNSLNKTDVYSLMLFTLFKLKDKPEYSTLSELTYILDAPNFTKFLRYYGGMTITIPTLKDMRLVLQALTLYQYVNLEGKDFKDGLAASAGEEFTEEELKATYLDILDVISNYEFERN